MNGTPSTSEAYAVLGSRIGGLAARNSERHVSLVVLTRGPWVLRPQVLTEYSSLGFSEVLCLETSPPRYDMEALLRSLPGLRIVINPGEVNPGTLINRAAREVHGDRFLVVWDDQSLADAGPYSRVIRLWQESRILALVPERRNRDGREIPSVMVPGLDADRLKILSLGADEENVATLFPADYSALYDRHRFLQTGGYDSEINHSFWQKAEWGLRCLLWGESLAVSKAFKVDYRSLPPVEDQTPDRSYSRFFLRTLAVRHVGDHGVLPWGRFWAHARRSGLPWLEAWGEFVVQRGWVHLHRYRYQTDARVLTELWGNL